jgi:hypothetical protein
VGSTRTWRRAGAEDTRLTHGTDTARDDGLCGTAATDSQQADWRSSARYRPRFETRHGTRSHSCKKNLAKMYVVCCTSRSVAAELITRSQRIQRASMKLQWPVVHR